MPADIAIEVYSAFARTFNLGKQAEDALQRWAEQAKKGEAGKAPENPELQAQAEKLKAETAEIIAKGKREDTKVKLDVVKTKAELARGAKEDRRADVDQEVNMHRTRAEMRGANADRDMRKADGERSEKLERDKLQDTQVARKEQADQAGLQQRLQTLEALLEQLMQPQPTAGAEPAPEAMPQAA